jgi:hypothetical protein
MPQRLLRGRDRGADLVQELGVLDEPDDLVEELGQRRRRGEVGPAHGLSTTLTQPSSLFWKISYACGASSSGRMSGTHLRTFA